MNSQTASSANQAWYPAGSLAEIDECELADAILEAQDAIVGLARVIVPVGVAWEFVDPSVVPKNLLELQHAVALGVIPLARVARGDSMFPDLVVEGRSRCVRAVLHVKHGIELYGSGLVSVGDLVMTALKDMVPGLSALASRLLRADQIVAARVLAIRGRWPLDRQLFVVRAACLGAGYAVAREAHPSQWRAADEVRAPVEPNPSAVGGLGDERRAVVNSTTRLSLPATMRTVRASTASGACPIARLVVRSVARSDD